MATNHEASAGTGIAGWVNTARRAAEHIDTWRDLGGSTGALGTLPPMTSSIIGCEIGDLGRPALHPRFAPVVA